MHSPKQPVVSSVPPEVPFPFDAEFQLKLLKFVLTEGGPIDLVFHHVKPHYFVTPDMRWCYQESWNYWRAYGKAPTLDVLRHHAQYGGGPLTPTLVLLLDRLQHTPLKEADWLREKLMEWARQNHFFESFKESQTLWQHNKRVEAMDLMQRRMEDMYEIMWRHRERVWYAEEVSRRQQLRERELQDYGETGDAISTGVADLDKVMGGGLSPGEMGIWIAYAKGGKSTMLLNHGAVAAELSKNVVHFVLEGSVRQVEDRYDAYFAATNYWKVKTGQMTGPAYADLFKRLQSIKRRLVLIGLLEKFDYTVVDIHAELQDLRRVHGWNPDMIIVDYGDLVQGRQGPYQAGWMSERDAFRDMKILANRGYAVWTASQARRPDTKNYDTSPHLLKVSQVAGAIEKARVTDFIGSINSTAEEKDQGVIRLYAEMYRDNQAGAVMTLPTEPAQMRFVGVQKESPSDSVGTGPGIIPPTPGLNYGAVPESWTPVQKN